MPASPTDEALGAAVSEAIVRLYLDKFGKGPMKVQTFVHGDVLTTLMSDIFTTGERTMIADGKGDSVLTSRMHWQQATAQMFRDAVGAAAGRPVASVVSGFELEDELATEVVVLAPLDAG